MHIPFAYFAPNVELARVGTSPAVKVGDRVGGSEVLANQKDEIQQVNVLVNIPLVHGDELNYGNTIEKELAGTLTNEMVDILIRQNMLAQKQTGKVPEAFGTVATVLSLIDDNTRQLFLGGEEHKKFTKMIADEIGQISTSRRVE